ncbi:MAG: hypothetical protein GKS01_07670 [Alphaproteobacteria bacterium]|nr:hypothetical protein [Alphaproteobacteria bacterium]
MAIFIPLAFIIIPVVEIAVFIQLGGEIGLWNTILLIILTAILGTWLLKSQGLATLQRAQESLARQVFPIAEVFDGLCLVVAGILLLTPGFVTDAVGFLLFLPFIRLILRTWIWAILARSGNSGVWVDAEQGGVPSNGRDGTIDGDFRDVTPQKPSNDPKLPPSDKDPS